MASWEMIHKSRFMRVEISVEDMYAIWMFGLHYHTCTWKTIRTFPVSDLFWNGKKIYKK